MFLKNYTQNAVEKLFPEPLLKNQNWAYLWIVWSFIQFVLLHSKLRTIKIYWNWAAYHLSLPHILHFWKTKRRLKLVSLPHFFYDFWRKIFLLSYSIIWPNFIAWLPLIHETLSNICIAIVCWPGCDFTKLETNQVVFSTWPKSQDQNYLEKVSRKQKEILRWIKKSFNPF